MIKADIKSDMLNFDKVDDELRRYIDANLESLAHRVKDRAKELCPVKEGRLKKSIRVQKLKDDEFRVIAHDPKAHLVEMGHVQEGRNGNIVGHVPPYPFLRPARDEVINDLLTLGSRNYDFAKSSGVFDGYWKG